MIESPSLEVIKMELDSVLDNIISVLFPVKTWTRGSFKFYSNLGCFILL